MQNLRRKSVMVRQLQQSKVLRQRCQKQIRANQNHSGLQQTLKPLLTGLQLLGLYYSNPCSNAWRRYGSVVFITLAASFAHSLTVFQTDEVYGSILFGKIQWCLLCFESMLIPLLFLRGFRREGPLELFFVRWDQTLDNEGLDRCKKRVVIAGVVVLLLNVSVNFFGLLLSIYVEPNIGNIIAEITWPRKKPNNNLTNIEGFHVGNDCNFSCQERRNYSGGIIQKSKISDEKLISSLGKGFIMTFFTFNTAINSASVSLLVVLCTLLAQKFHRLTHRLTEAITKQGRLLCDLGQLRYQHQRLIQLVETLDCGFSPVIALAFLTNIVIFTLNFYNLLYFQKESGYHTILFSIWFVTIVSQLTSISAAAARVNSSVSRFIIYKGGPKFRSRKRKYLSEF